MGKGWAVVSCEAAFPERDAAEGEAVRATTPSVLDSCWLEGRFSAVVLGFSAVEKSRGASEKHG